MKLIYKFLKKYPNIKSKKQVGKITWYRKFNSKDDRLDFDESISNRFNKIRSTDYKNHQNYFYINNQNSSLKSLKKK